MKHCTRGRGRALTMLAMLAGSATVHAQAPTAPVVPTTAVSAPTVPTTPDVPAPRASRSAPVLCDGASAQDIAQVREDIRKLRESLQTQIATVRTSWWERLIPLGIGLFGVFIGGLLGWLQQGRQLKLSTALQQQQLRENERIGRAKAGYESLSKVIEYQMRQVNEFYSPLRLMLQRSGGVRRQLCDQLVAKEPTRFQMVMEDDHREHLYVKEADGTTTPFRLIQHMHELITRHAELMPLVYEIVNIGVAMVDLINTKGGMAITGSEVVNTGLGRYLAHFSILRDVASKAKTAPALLLKIQYNVAYPRELDGALGADMATLAKQIEEWKALSRQMWEQASQGAPTPATA